MPQKYIFVLV